MKYHIRRGLAQIRHPEKVESLFIETERTGSKNVIVGVIYRPPSQDVKEFNDFTNVLLSKSYIMINLSTLWVILSLTC